MPFPDKKPQPLYDEVAEWNRLLDYEEDAMLKGIQSGAERRKKRLEEEAQSKKV